MQSVYCGMQEAAKLGAISKGAGLRGPRFVSRDIIDK